MADLGFIADRQKAAAPGALSYPFDSVAHGFRFEVVDAATLRSYWETNDLENARANGQNMIGSTLIWDNAERRFLDV